MGVCDDQFDQSGKYHPNVLATRILKNIGCGDVCQAEQCCRCARNLENQFFVILPENKKETCRKHLRMYLAGIHFEGNVGNYPPSIHSLRVGFGTFRFRELFLNCSLKKKRLVWKISYKMDSGQIIATSHDLTTKR